MLMYVPIVYGCLPEINIFVFMTNVPFEIYFVTSDMYHSLYLL